MHKSPKVQVPQIAPMNKFPNAQVSQCSSFPMLKFPNAKVQFAQSKKYLWYFHDQEYLWPSHGQKYLWPSNGQKYF